MTKPMLDIISIDMKYLRLLSWLLCCTVLMFSLASCEEKEPDLTKKEMDTRLLGTWKQINSNISENSVSLHTYNYNIVIS